MERRAVQMSCRPAPGPRESSRPAW